MQQAGLHQLLVADASSTMASHEAWPGIKACWVQGDGKVLAIRIAGFLWPMLEAVPCQI